MEPVDPNGAPKRRVALNKQESWLLFLSSLLAPFGAGLWLARYWPQASTLGPLLFLLGSVGLWLALKPALGKGKGGPRP